ncbi:MAG: amino acid ABC transporter permease [Erysipelotrichaceae bacterium]|nr:amino acid ABC transporter permease [Erysipelotrichaceae bacterium]
MAKKMSSIIEAFIKIFTTENILFMLKGARISLLIAICGTGMGIVLGVIAAILKISRNRFLNLIGGLYVEIIRGTPMLLQLSFFYLGVPALYQQLTGNYWSAPALLVGIVAIAINSGAYSCELIRSAINSIDKGQWEAGMSIGLSRNEIMKEIILPQSFKRILPPLANEFIVLIKDSSLVSTIGVVDLMKSSTILGTKYYNYFVPMIGTAIVYLTLTLITSKLTSIMERRLAESD